MSAFTFGQLRAARHACAVTCLVVLALAPARAQQGCGSSVTVERGDTLTRLAERCDTTEGRLLRANPKIEGSGDLRVGMKLDLRPPQQQLSDTLHAFGQRATEAVSGLASEVGSSVDDLLNKNPDLKQRLNSIGDQFKGAGVSSEAKLSLSSSSGLVGSPVTISGTGLPESTPVLVGVGPARSAYEVLDHARTNPDGTLRTTVHVPSSTSSQQKLVFVIAGEQGDWTVRSLPFEVVPGKL